MNRYLIVISFFFISLSVFAQKNPGKGYNIRVKLENYEAKEVVLGFYYGEKPYVKDTATLGSDGYFTFSADTLLPCGVYLFVTKPDNNFIQFLVPENDQTFSLTTDMKSTVDKAKFSGSADNEKFYTYLQMLNKLRPEADTLRAQLNRQKRNPEDSLKLTKKLADLDKKVKKYQLDLIEKNPGTLVSKIVKSSLEPEAPEFKGEEKEIQRQKYYWFRAHFFDNMDVTDVCLLRSPVLHSKIEQFVNKVIPQHPDSISFEIDKLIQKMEITPEMYRYYLIHFLNAYAKSNLVGMDGVYVFLAKKYYCSGKANWTGKEDVEKICDNASRLEPILIGKIAPNITVLDRDNQPHALWDVDADYTVLFFWDPECGHCKKAAPFMVEFAKKFQTRGVKVFAVCTAVTDKAPECWKSAEEKGFSDDIMLNRFDPYIKSRYKTLYDIRTTPQIFILDRKHEILMKRIGGEQLEKVMEEVIKFQEEKKNKGK